MPAAQSVIVNPLSVPLRGSVAVSGDKSISHRAVLIAAMAEGTSRVTGLLDSADIRSSIAAVQKLGARISLELQEDLNLAGDITGWGTQGPLQPESPLDCGNSATTARLLMGVLAPWDMRVELTGDRSLLTRPMRRVMVPLMKMGVEFQPANRDTLPLVMRGSRNLRAVSYKAPLASAQVKSAVIFAGIYARGTTVFNELAPSRNHTELMLPGFAIDTAVSACGVSVTGPAVPCACDVRVPGDPSSAAFLVCAAVLKPCSFVRVENVSLNATRIGFVRVLQRMGAKVDIRYVGLAGKEPYGTISAHYAPKLYGCEVPADTIASLIDEIPVLALVAAFAHGLTVFREVGELRVKESNRLTAVVGGLCAFGANAWIDDNNLYIKGCPNLCVPQGLSFDAQGDHRLAMTWALVGLCGAHSVEIKDFNSLDVSYPKFLFDVERLTR